jgi:dihydrofolate reductase
MGRKTFESLPNGALPNRHNIVITTKISYNDINIIGLNMSLTFKDDIEELIEKYKNSEEEVFVIGGGLIYQQFLPYCKKIYWTTVIGEYNADTFFKFNPDEWIKEWGSEVLNSNGYTYDFINLIRKIC